MLNKKKRERIIIPSGIYGITGDNFSNGKSNFRCVKEMIDGGIKIIQYRDKLKTMKEKIKEIKEIRKLCKEKNVIFIVNDHVDVAFLVDADGVHLGQDDMAPSDARKLLGPDKIIGVSTHSEEQGLKAYENRDVDYIGVGPIFPTTTKDTAPVGIEYLDYVVKNLNLPFVAIGGIKEDNIEKIIERGATRISLVSEILGADDITYTTKKLSSFLKK